MTEKLDPRDEMTKKYRRFKWLLVSKLQMPNDEWFHWDRLLYTCADWRNWPPPEKERYAIGLTHGLKLWMEWETHTGDPIYSKEWEKARGTITDQDVYDKIDEYCADPCDDLLSQAAATIVWRLAQEKGVPLPGKF